MVLVEVQDRNQKLQLQSYFISVTTWNRWVKAKPINFWTRTKQLMQINRSARIEICSMLMSKQCVKIKLDAIFFNDSNIKVEGQTSQTSFTTSKKKYNYEKALHLMLYLCQVLESYNQSMTTKRLSFL
jgi:hypothetical protein